MFPTGHEASPERLEEFKAIYKEAYGEEITRPDAAEITRRLLALYQLLARPLHTDEGEPASPSLPRPDSTQP
ncbi:hypothetical protein [Bradyrhizobium sp. DASA03120]|uniref:hypothetical protein n=1 Tax=Bradyrhizobium sp. SMVTL-02 TaxID=3395917 RepID=UPI003F6E6D46